jgi:putative transposase
MLDLFNGEIVAYEMARRPLFGMIDTTLRRAFARLGPGDRPILHFDQGWQYRMPVYREALKRQEVTQSMSRQGNCRQCRDRELLRDTEAGVLRCGQVPYLRRASQWPEAIHRILQPGSDKTDARRPSPVEYRTQFGAA